MEQIGMQAVDTAISKGIDLDGSPIPAKMLNLYRTIMDKENKRKRTGVLKSMRNRCVKTGSKHYQREELNYLLLEAGWPELSDREIAFYYT